jgi:hypothetical protein
VLAREKTDKNPFECPKSHTKKRFLSAVLPLLILLRFRVRAGLSLTGAELFTVLDLLGRSFPFPGSLIPVPVFSEQDGARSRFCRFSQVTRRFLARGSVFNRKFAWYKICHLQHTTVVLFCHMGCYFAIDLVKKYEKSMAT